MLRSSRMRLRHSCALWGACLLIALVAAACASDDALEGPSQPTQTSSATNEQASQGLPLVAPSSARDVSLSDASCDHGVQAEGLITLTFVSLIRAELIIVRALGEDLIVPRRGVFGGTEFDSDQVSELLRQANRIAGLRLGLADVARLPVDLQNSLSAISSDLYDFEISVRNLADSGRNRERFDELDEELSSLEEQIAEFVDRLGALRADCPGQISQAGSSILHRSVEQLLLALAAQHGAISRSCAAFDCFGGEGDWRPLIGERRHAVLDARREIGAWRRLAFDARTQLLAEQSDQRVLIRAVAATADLEIRRWEHLLGTLPDAQQWPADINVGSLESALFAYQVVVAYQLTRS